MSDLPPLPSLEGDTELMLDVYTHKSLQRRAEPNPTSIHGDTDRLAELGGKVLDLTITYHLFSQRPFMTPDEIKGRKDELMSGGSIDGWLNSYQLKSKLFVLPDQASMILSNELEMIKFFQIFVGAVYIRHGLPTVQQWISRLIDPNGDPPALPEARQQQQQPPPQQQYGFQYGSQYTAKPMMGHYSQPSYSNYPTGGSSTMGGYSPVPPPGPPPPLPASPPSMMAPQVTSLVTLALVNQTAAQRGFQVSYPAHQDGPPHQPTWTVRCCMNGQEKGIGVGKSQKLAKEEAARQAWAAMGWGPT